MENEIDIKKKTVFALGVDKKLNFYLLSSDGNLYFTKNVTSFASGAIDKTCKKASFKQLAKDIKSRYFEKIRDLKENGCIHDLEINLKNDKLPKFTIHKSIDLASLNENYLLIDNESNDILYSNVSFDEVLKESCKYTGDNYYKLEGFKDIVRNLVDAPIIGWNDFELMCDQAGYNIATTGEGIPDKDYRNNFIKNYYKLSLYSQFNSFTMSDNQKNSPKKINISEACWGINKSNNVNADIKLDPISFLIERDANGKVLINNGKIQLKPEAGRAIWVNSKNEIVVNALLFAKNPNDIEKGKPTHYILLDNGVSDKYSLAKLMMSYSSLEAIAKKESFKDKSEQVHESLVSVVTITEIKKEGAKSDFSIYENKYDRDSRTMKEGDPLAIGSGKKGPGYKAAEQIQENPEQETKQEAAIVQDGPSR